MEVIRAEAMGMCFGVRDALKIVNAIAEPDRVTIHGDLVHNEAVLHELARRGFRAVPEADRAAIPESPEVLITAHGVSERERRRLTEAGKALIDTTCPLVRVVHEAAQRFHRQGYFLVVIGKRGHVEVEGITGDLERFAVVQSRDEVTRYPADKIAIVCQSTTPPFEAAPIRREIELRNAGKEVRFADTICRPTKERQQAMRDLVAQVEAVVVVGGARSNNTKQLVRLAEAHGRPVLHVRNAADLDPRWLARFHVVGLTAGTSTLDHTIDEVHEALLAVEPARAGDREAVPVT